MTTAGRAKSAGGGRKPRSIARMAAVQALYQMEMAGADLADVVDEFKRLRFTGRTIDPEGEGGDDLTGADQVFFAELLRGVVRRQRDIDPGVDQQLASGWRLTRVDSILRAILRAGVFELMERPDIPARAVITEYVNIAHAFFDADEPKVVNGVLDALARRLRASEFEAPGKGSGTA
jgi:N utilization substance protein B